MLGVKSSTMTVTLRTSLNNKEKEVAAFDWLTGDSPASRQERRERRAREAAEAEFRAQEHRRWLESLSPTERQLYDQSQEIDRLRSSLSSLESDLIQERWQRECLENRLSNLESR